RTLGGQALPLAVDVRHDSSVESAVNKTIEEFGRIDILINNASAISLTGTTETPMKKFDLMHNVNTRGTYLLSKLCIPHLEKASNPHILNISPPLNMKSKWFAPNVAYTMSKYGMSMCVLGMSEELKSRNIAVNALWPRTAILTAATKMLLGDEASKLCRNPEIMSDAAHRILTKSSKSSKNTGNFYIDDNVLRESGMTDFTKYNTEHSSWLSVNKIDY
ncbi:hypothetical protein Ciccas_009340, partial [Cichlidogyrus casuarinus]